MKTELQKYERQTGKIVWLSAGLFIVGTLIYFAWSSLGAVIVLVGVMGLGWSFLRR